MILATSIKWEGTNIDALMLTALANTDKFGVFVIYTCSFHFKIFINILFSFFIIQKLSLILYYHKQNYLSCLRFRMECVYRNPCYAFCKNENCKKPGIICCQGMTNRNQCFLFHEGCQNITLESVQELCDKNQSKKKIQFKALMIKIQSVFIKAIEKIREQQKKFRVWMKTFGHSFQVTKFINSMESHSYQDISGHSVSSFLKQHLQSQSKIYQKITCPNVEQVDSIIYQIEKTIQKISHLYQSKTKSKSKIQSKKSEEKRHYQSQQILNNNLSPINNSRVSINQQKSENSLRKRRQRQEQILSKAALSSLKLFSNIYQDVSDIKKMFPSKQLKNLNLIFRASQNDFKISEFHRICDQTPNTLILIKTQFDNIIGGYTSLLWKSDKKQWKADKFKQTFIFSLSLKEKYELNLPQFAISCNPDKGPIFGCCDICIVDNSNKQKSTAEFPISFNIDKKYHRGAEATQNFVGSPQGQYRIKEWEVFQVQFSQ